MINLRLAGNVGYEITADGISEFLNENDDKDITIFLNSPGGYVTEGLEIYNLLRASGRNITTVLTGMAASMASIIFLAGDRRIAMTGTLYMVHKPSGLAWGNADEMRKEIEVLDKMQDSAAAIYQERTGIEDFNDYMNEVTYFDTVEMKELGITNSDEKVTFALESSKNEKEGSMNLESEENMSIEELKEEKAKLEAEKAQLEEQLEESRLEAEIASMRADNAALRAEVEPETEDEEEDTEEVETETDEEEVVETEVETETDEEEEEETEIDQEPTAKKQINTKKTVAVKSKAASKIPAFMQAESKY